RRRDGRHRVPRHRDCRRPRRPHRHPTPVGVPADLRRRCRHRGRRHPPQAHQPPRAGPARRARPRDRGPAVNATAIVLAGAAAAATFMLVAAGRYISRKLDRRLALTTGTALAVGAALWVYVAHGLLLLTLALLAVGATVGGWVQWRRSSNASTVTRVGERARRRSGVATWWQIARRASWWAMHRKARAVRPHLRTAGLPKRWAVPAAELGVRLCRSAGLWIYVPIEQVVLLFGGPRKGKTAWLAGAICDAPGAVLTTSTRTEIIGLTRAAREKDDRPLWVFNPGGLGDLESTVAFNPLIGCADPVTATARAADMIPESEGGEGDRDFWEGQARKHFATFLHAAALDPTGRRTMRDVQRWVANPKAASEELNTLLKLSPDPTPYLEDLNQFIDLADKTQTSITNAITPALGWLTSPSAVAATEGGTLFDVAELIRQRGTVYLLGRHEAHTAPLLAALTGYVAREARRLAALEELGRLDPPLTIALDEAARISPVPLPDW